MTPDVIALIGSSGVIASIVTVGSQFLLTRHKSKTIKTAQDDRLVIHRDELMFEILQTARTEMSAAKIEVVTLRDEVHKLRSMEEHFYHFQQALDHLEALLSCEDDTQRKTAERNARKFLDRMPERNIKAFLSRIEGETAVRKARNARQENKDGKPT